MARNYLPALEMFEERLVLDGAGLLGAALLPAAVTTLAAAPADGALGAPDRSVAASPASAVVRAAPEPAAVVVAWEPAPAVRAVPAAAKSVDAAADVVHQAAKATVVKVVSHKEARPVEPEAPHGTHRAPAEHRAAEDGAVPKPATEAEVRAAERSKRDLRAEDARAAREDARAERHLGEKNGPEKAAGRDHDRGIEPARPGAVRVGPEVANAAVIGTVIQAGEGTGEASAPVADGGSAFGAGDGVLASFLPFDPSQLEATVNRLLDQLTELRGEVSEWLLSGGVAPWVTVAAATMMVAEIARRQRRQGQAGPRLLAGATSVA